VHPTKGVHVSTSTKTAGCGAYIDCKTTDTIGNAIKSSIASPVGTKNQKKVECFMSLDHFLRSGTQTPLTSSLLN
jgi:hypothetical protein